MIILEGPDGCGKSTLKKQIQDKYGFEEGTRGTLDRTKLYEVTVSDTFRALYSAMKANQQPLIWDRLYWSELVYPKYMGRECQFNPGQQKLIQNLFSMLHIPIIWCRPTLRTIRANIQDTDQMDGVHDNIRDIVYDYDLLISRRQNIDFVYDYQVQSVESVYSYIEDYLKERQAREW